LKLIAQMNSFQNCCLFFGFTKIWFCIIPLPCEEQQQQQLPSSCFNQWDDRWRCPANQVRLRLTIWFKHIKHLTISIYQDVFVQIGTVRTGKSDTDRDWWKWNVYFGHKEFSYYVYSLGRPHGEDEKSTIPSCPALRYIMWPAGYGPANHLEASAAALKRTCTLLRLAARRRRQSSNDSEAKRTLDRPSKHLRIGNKCGTLFPGIFGGSKVPSLCGSSLAFLKAVVGQFGLRYRRCRSHKWPNKAKTGLILLLSISDNLINHTQCRWYHIYIEYIVNFDLIRSCPFNRVISAPQTHGESAHSLT